MALTRKFLSALGIEAEKVDEIITAHTETVDALKEQRDSYKADAEKLATVQAELDKLKENATENDGENPFEVKFNDLQKEFDQYKKDIEAKEKATQTREAYRKLLLETGVAEKRIDAVLKVTDISDMKLDKDGKLENAEELTKSIKTEWAEFIGNISKQGADIATPPENNGGKTFKDLPLAEKMTFANQHPNDAEVREWLK